MIIREKLNRTDIRHRQQFARYATQDSASDWHREMLDRLYRTWDSINGDVRVYGPRVTTVQTRARYGSIKADLPTLGSEATPESASACRTRPTRATWRASTHSIP